MAKSDIELGLKTKYEGEGMNKLKQDVQKTDQVIKKASGAINQVTASLGGMNNAAGKAAQAVTGLASSFAQGGVWGVAAAGAMMVVNAIIDGFNTAREKAKEAAEAAKDAFMKSCDAISERVSKMMESFSRTRKNEDNIFDTNKSLFNDMVSEAEIAVKRKHIESRYGMSSKQKIDQDKLDEQSQIAEMRAGKAISLADADYLKQKQTSESLAKEKAMLDMDASEASDKVDRIQMQIDANKDAIKKEKAKPWRE